MSYRGYVVIYDKKKHCVVGYFSVVSLSPKYYKILRKGSSSDIDLPAIAILPLNAKRTHLFYCSSLALHPDYKNTLAFAILLRAILNHAQHLTEQGIYGKILLADAVSNDGRTLCEQFGLQKIGETPRKTSVYELDFEHRNGAIWSTRLAKINALYEKRESVKCSDVCTHREPHGSKA